MNKYVRIKRDDLIDALNRLSYIETYTKAHMEGFEVLSQYDDDRYKMMYVITKTIYDGVHDSKNLLQKEF